METTTNNQLVQVNAQQMAVNYFDEKQFAVVQRVCKLFANSDLVPDNYNASKKGEAKAIANCVIALEMANRIGASPLMIMQNMYIVYGRPSWSSPFLIATINSCGRFKPLKFKFTEKGMLGMVDVPGGKQFDGKKIMDVECVAYTTEKDSDEVLESSPVSIRLAVQEGWYTKNGSKWQTIPRQMLMYRAATFWTRTYAPELSMGMRTTDEWQDIHEAEFEEVKDEVEKEIDTEANSVELSMEEETPQTEEVVDEETGEVTEAPSGAENNPAPTKEKPNQNKENGAQQPQPEMQF